MDTEKKRVNLEDSKVFNLADLVDYGDGAIVSRTIVKEKTGTVTLFAFDKAQELSEHTAPFEALVNIVDGSGVIIINGVEYVVEKNQVILMPANIPHGVRADQRFKMVLTMIRE